MPLKTSLISRFRWLVLAVAAPCTVQAADLRIEHVTIVSPQRDSEMHDAVVRVHDGRIVSISKAKNASARTSSDTVIDGRGMFLSPGLIDSHVHLGEIPGMTSDQEARHPDI